MTGRAPTATAISPDGQTGAVYLGHLDPPCLNFASTPFAVTFHINLLFA
jgi:hypothetical protein